MDSMHLSDSGNSQITCRNSACNTNPIACASCGSKDYVQTVPQTHCFTGFYPGIPRCGDCQKVCEENLAGQSPKFSIPWLPPFCYNTPFPPNFYCFQNNLGDGLGLHQNQAINDIEKLLRQSSLFGGLFFPHKGNTECGADQTSSNFAGRENEAVGNPTHGQNITHSPRCGAHIQRCPCADPFPWICNPYIMPLISSWVLWNSLRPNITCSPCNQPVKTTECTTESEKKTDFSKEKNPETTEANTLRDIEKPNWETTEKVVWSDSKLTKTEWRNQRQNQESSSSFLSLNSSSSPEDNNFEGEEKKGESSTSLKNESGDSCTEEADETEVEGETGTDTVENYDCGESETNSHSDHQINQSLSRESSDNELVETENQLLYLPEKVSEMKEEDDQMSIPVVDYDQMSTPGVDDGQMSTPGVDHDQMSTPRVDDNEMSTPGVDYDQMSTPGVDDNEMSTPGVDDNEMSTPGVDYDQMSTPGVDDDQMSTPRVDDNQMSTPVDDDQMSTPEVDDNEMSTPGVDYDQMSTPGVDDDQMSTPRVDDNQMSTPVDDDQMSTPGVDDDQMSTPGVDDHQLDVPAAEIDAVQMGSSCEKLQECTSVDEETFTNEQENMRNRKAVKSKKSFKNFTMADQLEAELRENFQISAAAAGDLGGEPCVGYRISISLSERDPQENIQETQTEENLESEGNSSSPPSGQREVTPPKTPRRFKSGIAKLSNNYKPASKLVKNTSQEKKVKVMKRNQMSWPTNVSESTNTSKLQKTRTYSVTQEQIPSLQSSKCKTTKKKGRIEERKTDPTKKVERWMKARQQTTASNYDKHTLKKLNK